MLLGWIPIIWFLLILVIVSDMPSDKKNESIISDIEVLITNEQYEFALKQAELIRWGNVNDSKAIYWEMRKENVIKKILSEAAVNGVVIEYTPKEEDNEDEKETNSETDIFNHFKEGMSSEIDKIKENVDEFSRIIDGESLDK
jgi:hypothetical protein